MKTSLVLASLTLALCSCTSTFVPFPGEENPPVQGETRDPGLDSVVYQGDKAKKPDAKKARNAILFLLGGRSFNEDDWMPVEDQVFFGSEWSFIPAESIVGVEAGFGFSYKQADMLVGSTTFTFTGSTFEVYVGPRLEIGLGDSPVRLYAGLGPSFINAGYKGEVIGFELSESDNSLGFYIHGGALVELGSVYLGLDVRALTGTSITLFNIELDADYTQVAGVLGFRF